MNKKVFAIAAMAENRVIGNKNTIPWHLPEDMQRFKELTTGHAVMMGSKTYWSLPEKFRPLPKRQNVVVTRNPDAFAAEQDVLLVGDPIQFIQDFKNEKLDLVSDTLWVIGGSQIYEVTKNLWDEVYITEVKGEYDGDSYFPKFEDSFIKQVDFSNDQLVFLRYVSK